MKVLVFGKGISGDGFGNFLRKEGAEVVFFDQKLGHTLEEVDWKVDAAFLSPGILEDNPIYMKVGQKGIPTLNDFDYFYSKFKGKIIAVTGTAGKTTATQLIAHLLQIPYAGNMGVNIFDYMDQSMIALEISELQLSRTQFFACHYGILVNLSIDHGETHAHPSSYIAAKYKLLRKGPHDQYFIGPFVTKKPLLTALEVENIPAHLHHLHTTISYCFTVASHLGLSLEKCYERLYTFTPPAWRQERHYYGKRLVINNSKATNILAVINSFEDYNNMVWIAGGRLKNKYYDVDLSPLLPYVKRMQKAMFFGEHAQVLADFFSPHMVVEQRHSLKELAPLLKQTSADAVIIFSPLGQSFDQYSSFKERGLEFRVLCEEIFTPEA